MIFFRSSLSELISPFMMTFGVMSVILVMQKFYALATLMLDRQFPAYYLVLMIFFLLPQIFSVTIPLGVIGAVFMTVIRKSMDAEIIAFRASGKSLWLFSAPFLVFGLVTALIALVVTVWLMPYGYQKYSELQVRMVQSHAENNLVPGRFNDAFGKKVIQVGGRLPTGEFTDIFITSRVYRPGHSITMADRGRIVVDNESRQVFLRLESGTSYAPSADRKSFQETRFERLNHILSLTPANTSVEVNTLKQMSTFDLAEVIQNPKTKSSDGRRAVLELFYRLTLPWGCFVFSLAAIPMAIVDTRSGRSGSFLRAIFLVMTYYIIWIGFKDMVQSGKASAWVLWLPLLLVLLFGIFRLWQANSDVRVNLSSFLSKRRI